MTDEVYVMQKNYLRFGSNPLNALSDAFDRAYIKHSAVTMWQIIKGEVIYYDAFNIYGTFRNKKPSNTDGCCWQ